MLTRGLIALALAVVPALAPADDAKLPDAKAFDKSVIDSLRAVHNAGADLYNEGKDFAGAYRVYQGALLTVQPLLGHRPEAQKLIDTGLAAADKEADPARKAYLLHETIEAVRKNLKTAAEPKKVAEPPVKKPDEPKRIDPPQAEPPVKKSDDPVKPALPVAPPPRVKSKG